MTQQLHSLEISWRNHYSHVSGDLYKNAYDTANTKQKQTNKKHQFSISVDLVSCVI